MFSAVHILVRAWDVSTPLLPSLFLSLTSACNAVGIAREESNMSKAVYENIISCKECGAGK
jgi:hypothetical protein